MNIENVKMIFGLDFTEEILRVSKVVLEKVFQKSNLISDKYFLECKINFLKDFFRMINIFQNAKLTFGRLFLEVKFTFLKMFFRSKI